MSYIFLRLVNFAFRFICTQIYELFLHIHHKFPIIFSIPIIFLITTPKKLLENGESYQIHEFGTNRKRSTTASVFAVVLLFVCNFIIIICLSQSIRFHSLICIHSQYGCFACRQCGYWYADIYASGIILRHTILRMKQ